MAAFRKLIREIHRRSLWQVLGIYLVGSWGVLQVVQAVTETAGLPDWTPGFAFVLVLIGLPVCVATAFIQEGGPVRKATDWSPEPGEYDAPSQPASKPSPNLAAGTGSLDRPSTRPPRIKRLMTWKRAMLGGLAAGGLLVLSTVAYVVMWSAGIGPVGNLVAQGVIEEGATVVLADFQDSGDLGAVVTEALRVDLQSSPILNVVPPARVGAALDRMGLPADTEVSEGIAREIAIRDGYATILSGRVGRVGESRLITASLVEASSGRVLSSFRTTAESESELLAAVDALSQDVREKSGEGLRSIRAGEPLDVVTTASLDALRLYGRGSDLISQGRAIDAIPLLEDAIELDPDFAMAHRKLSVAFNNTGIDRTRGREAAARAYELRDRLTEREQGIAEAYYFSRVEDDPDRAMRAYRQVLDRYPDDGTALNNLGVLANQWGQYEEAERVLRRLVEGPFPIVQSIVNLQIALWARGKEAEARAVLEEGLEIHGREGTLAHANAWLLAAEGRWAEAHEAHEDNLRAQVGNVSAQVAERMNLAAADLARGSWREAMEHLDDAESAALEAEQFEMFLFGPTLMRGLAVFGTLGSVSEARRTLEEALTRVPEDILQGSDALGSLSQTLALVGSAEADRVFEAYSSVAGRGRQYRLDEALFEAQRALGREDFEEAADTFEDIFDRIWPCGAACVGKIPYGIALEGAGRLAEAAEAIEVQLARSAMPWEFVVVPFYPIALDRLGHIYEALGDPAAAAGAYQRLIDMWPNPDPELRPMLANARSRYRELTAAAAGS